MARYVERAQSEQFKHAACNPYEREDDSAYGAHAKRITDFTAALATLTRSACRLPCFPIRQQNAPMKGEAVSAHSNRLAYAARKLFARRHRQTGAKTLRCSPILRH